MERMHNTAGSFVQGDVKGMMQDTRYKMQDAIRDTGMAIADFGFAFLCSSFS
jgi:hypothetical protein